MTDDLVKRLRIAADRADMVFDPDFSSPWREAADRIEQLEAALRKIKQSDKCGCQSECIEMCKIAEAALGDKKDG